MINIWLTWNPITGCTKYSDGCKNCYALSMALKFQKLGVPKYKNGFEITFHKNTLNFPEKTKRPSIIFANSMTDLFQEGIPFNELKQVFDTMNKNNHHIYFVLTKRAERMFEFTKKLEIGEHIRIGVTIESKKYLERLQYLKQINCKKKWICIEPLLSDFKNIDLSGINWVTGGTESGPKRRISKTERIENITKICQYQNIPFSFKHRNTPLFNKKGLEEDSENNGRKLYYQIPKEIKEFEKKSLEYNKKSNKNQLKIF